MPNLIPATRILGVLFLLYPLGSVICGPQPQELGAEKKGAAVSPAMPFDESLLEVKGDLGSFKSKIGVEEIEPGIRIITLTLKSEKAASPPKFSLTWRVPSMDVNAFWNPMITPVRTNYYYNEFTSRASRNAPVITLYNNASQNRLTFACSDALNRVDLKTRLKEEDAWFYCTLKFFEEKTPAVTHYETKIRIDTRSIPFHKAVSDVGRWWEEMPRYKPAPVPDAARQPMYSTWYSFHQNLVVKDLVAECRLAKSLGFEAVIVDDGWQTLDSQRGYAYTGDWEPERIPQFKEFVKTIHDLDMKFLLWYSLPFMGEKARNQPKFEGKFLKHWKEQGTYVLDPRYPEVREFIINTYEEALKKWNLDGFKLDFIGRFSADENTVMEAIDGRDFAGVNEATDRLMTDIMARLRILDPNIMIEFRQPYIGPLMRKYGNMFRGVDCANNAVANRMETTDLRLLSGNTAVHSDMFMWHPQESPESAALQILNILFSVPQLSVRLDGATAQQLEMVKFWIGYWKTNRSVLLDGVFTPMSPASMYPVLKATLGKKTIAAVYDRSFVQIDAGPGEVLDVVNATGGEQIVLDFAKSMGSVRLQTWDCRGRLVEDRRLEVGVGVQSFKVPESGLFSISP